MCWGKWGELEGGALALKWRGLLLIIALWPLHKGKRGCRDDLNLNGISPSTPHPHLICLPTPKEVVVVEGK